MHSNLNFSDIQVYVNPVISYVILNIFKTSPFIQKIPGDPTTKVLIQELPIIG